MTIWRRSRAAGLVVAGLLVVAGCGGGSEERAEQRAAAAQEQLAVDCRSAVDSLLATAQRYLDSIDSTTTGTAAGDSGAAPQDGGDAAEQEQQFTAALGNIRSYAAGLGCEPRTFRDDLTRGLEQLRTGGPVARAVLLQLQADAEPGRTPGTVPAGGDLAAAVAAAPAGAVVQLEAGEYELPEALVLLRGVTVRGAGRDATTVRSAAGSGVVLALTGEPTVLEQLSLQRTGEAPGPVVSVAPSAALSLTGVRVSGARADAEGTGGVGVLLAAGAAGRDGLSRTPSLRFTDSETVDNAVAGLVVGGQHRAEVSRVTVGGSGQCGICFLDTSDGSVSDSSLTDNTAGVVVADQARPLLTRVSVRGGDVGVQAMGSSAPQLQEVDVRGATRAALLFADSSTGAVRASTCEQVPAELVVGPSAAPEVQGEGCTVVRGQ